MPLSADKNSTTNTDNKGVVMSAILLTPEKMLDVIPGEVTIRGTVDTASENGMSLRGYRFDKTEVSIPCMRDYELVRWKTGTSNLGFHDGKKWQKGAVGNDDVTILTRGESSRWYWMNDIEVSHIYISQAMMAKVANEVFQKDIDGVFVSHCPIANDAKLSKLMAAYEMECLSDEPGSSIYAQALEIQICIHLIRQYVRCDLRDGDQVSRLSNIKRDQLQEYIDSHLACPISVKDMATIVDLSPSYFVRVFGTVYGVSPHQYVQARRLKRAERLLSTLRDVPLKAVAMDCGFSDQSHMTRLFKEKLLMTPKQYREKNTSRLFCSLTVQ
jgi:AraC family transcriptional regulator